MYNNLKKIFLCFIFLAVNFNTFAWDNTGHRLIAQIAYDHLTPETKTKVDFLTKILDPNYPAKQRFLYDSTWLDQIKYSGVRKYNAWHFIDLPFSLDDTKLITAHHPNSLDEIKINAAILKNPQQSNYQKAQALRILIHLVGDVHQPLHCADRYSREYPHGDKGGNLFKIKNEDVKNLHAFWDEGLDLFYGISRNAKRVESDYPEAYFGSKVNDLNPQAWAQQSFTIAKNFAYNLKENTQPSEKYIKEGQKIAEQQIALAGYRLAEELNVTISFTARGPVAAAPQHARNLRVLGSPLTRHPSQ